MTKAFEDKEKKTQQQQMLSVRQFAYDQDLSKSSVRRFIKLGSLRVHRLGRVVRISPADRDSFLATSRGENL